MFKNHLKIAIRHISRNKGYVFINVIGLGIAIAVSMIAFVNWQSAEIADGFHEQSENIYRIVANRLGTTRPIGDVTTALAEYLPEDIAEVEGAIRFAKRGVIVQNDMDVFDEGLALVDPNFFDVFTYPLLAGDPTGLTDPNKIFISEEKAKKYFDDLPPVGQTLTINPAQENARSFIIAGVIKDFPKTSCMQFDFLTNIAYLESGPRPDTLSNWNNRENAAFVLLDEGARVANVENQLEKYIPLQNKAMPGDKVVKYFLQPLGNVFKEAESFNNHRLNGAVSSSFYWGPVVMAFMILFTACLNFTNTTISFSNKRLKEMGVRKVMGSGRTQLMTQLLSESFLICLLALGLGVILAEYLTPLYNSLWSEMDLALSMDYLSNIGLVKFIIVAVLVGTIMGGAYPAFYISSFRPAHIFRGTTKFGGDNWLVRTLLGLQIVTALIAIIGSVTFSENAEFQKNFDLGYNTDGIINVRIDGEKHYEAFKNVIAENPNILGVSGSRNNLGFGNWWSNIGKIEDNRSVQVQIVGENFIEVMGIPLLEGRTFDKEMETDFENSVLINRKLMEEQQWTTGLGQEIEMYGQTKKVIGVIDNFYQSGFFQGPTPSVFHFEKPARFRYMKVKTKAANLIATNDFLKEKWTANFPLIPFTSFYQDETFADTLMVSQNVTYINIFLSIVTILLAATGLFSLVSLNVLKRAKEIAVRRVLGASPENITYTINKHYILVFLIGGLLGAILGGWFAHFLMDNIFDVYQDVNYLSIGLSVIGICIIGALTIGGRLFTVLQTNPADTLKSE